MTDIQQEKLLKKQLAQQLNDQAENDHPSALSDKVDNNDEKNLVPRKAPGNKIITVAERLAKFRAAKKSSMATNSTSDDVEKKQIGKKVKPKQKPNKNKMNNKNHVDNNGLENAGAKTKSNDNTEADEKDKGSDQKSSKGDRKIMFSKLNFDDDTKKPKKISEVQMLNKLETKKKKVEKVKQVDPTKVYAL